MTDNNGKAEPEEGSMRQEEEGTASTVASDTPVRSSNVTAQVVLKRFPLRFDPTQGEVYFDRCNRQLVTTRAKEVRRLSLRPETDTVKISSIVLSFAIDSPCIKFSLDHHYLAVQRSKTHVQFLNLSNHTLFTQACKRPSSEILEFFWTGTDTLIFVTTNGFELYQYSKTRNLRLVREFKMPTHWFVFSAKLLLLATGATGHVMHGFYFKGSTITKIPKFEVSNLAANGERITVKQSDVIVSRMYDRVYCVYHNPATHKLHLYQLSRDHVTPSVTVNVPTTGDIGIHIVDNLLVVHNIENKMAILFDIKEPDCFVAAPLPLAGSSSIHADTDQLYAPSWEFHQPNCILDRVNGFLWQVDVDLHAIATSFANKTRLVKFLLRRANSKKHVLAVIKEMIEEGSSLAQLSRIFSELAKLLKENPERESSRLGGSVNQSLTSLINSDVASSTEASAAEERASTRSRPDAVVVTQGDIHLHVFYPLEDDGKLSPKYFVGVLIEYIRSLFLVGIDVQHSIFEMVINALVRDNKFYQLHQFLQYHVVTDSVPVACQLLSLEQRYPPAGQLALDMLKRQKSSQSSIIDVLLSRQQVLPALRLLRRIGLTNDAPVDPSRFLETALSTGDRTLFFTVYKFFEGRHQLKGPAAKFTHTFQKLFSEE